MSVAEIQVDAWNDPQAILSSPSDERFPKRLDVGSGSDSARAVDPAESASRR